jgi:hypothetical protein
MKIVLFLLFLLLNGSAHAEWEQLDENNQAIIYFDPDRIQRNSGFPTLWQLSDLKSPTQTKVLSKLTLIEFNCDERQRRTIAFTSHREHMAAGKPIFKSLVAQPWHAVQPESVIEKLMDLACKP